MHLAVVSEPAVWIMASWLSTIVATPTAARTSAVAWQHRLLRTPAALAVENEAMCRETSAHPAD